MSGAVAERRRGCTIYADEPLGFHAAEIGAAVIAQTAFGIEDEALRPFTGEHHPVPGRARRLAMPFDGEKGERWQFVPGDEGFFVLRGVEMKAVQELSNRVRAGPKRGVVDGKTEFDGKGFDRGVALARDGGDARDRAAGGIFLKDGAHEKVKKETKRAAASR